jgi:exonuclease VII large subunit
MKSEQQESISSAMTNLHTSFAELLARQKVQITELQQQSVANHHVSRMKREVKQDERFDEMMKALMAHQFPTNKQEEKRHEMKSTQHHHEHSTRQRENSNRQSPPAPRRHHKKHSTPAAHHENSTRHHVTTAIPTDTNGLLQQCSAIGCQTSITTINTVPTMINKLPPPV